MFLLLSVPTFGTNTFKHIVNTGKPETFGKLYHRNIDMLQAKRPMTSLTIKMCMFIFRRTVVIPSAHIIFQRATSIINGMYQPVHEKKRQCT